MDREPQFYGDTAESDAAGTFSGDLTRVLNGSPSERTNAKVCFREFLDVVWQSSDDDVQDLAAGTSWRPAWRWAPDGRPIYCTQRPWIAYTVVVDTRTEPPLATFYGLAMADEAANEQAFWRTVLDRYAGLERSNA
jgi:hypothetical protein